MAAATTGLVAAGLAASVGPANAQVLDTDHPRVNVKSHAFGTNWVLGAPVNGGDLTWDLTNGITTASLSGYHYLSDKHCGRIFVEDFTGSVEPRGPTSRTSPAQTTDVDTVTCSTLGDAHAGARRQRRHLRMNVTISLR